MTTLVFRTISMSCNVLDLYQLIVLRTACKRGLACAASVNYYSMPKLNSGASRSFQGSVLLFQLTFDGCLLPIVFQNWSLFYFLYDTTIILPTCLNMPNAKHKNSLVGTLQLIIECCILSPLIFCILWRDLLVNYIYGGLRCFKNMPIIKYLWNDYN